MCGFYQMCWSFLLEFLNFWFTMEIKYNVKRTRILVWKSMMNNEVKVVVLGESGSGKTSFVHALLVESSFIVNRVAILILINSIYFIIVHFICR